MSTPYERGQSALDELILWAEEHSAELDRNEATTRLHLINSFLEDVLAWPKADIEAEPRLENEYLDYRLGRPFPRMIVEAKREGSYFTVPAGMASLIQKLSSLTEGPSGKALREAAVQVARYCATNGVPIAVVSNGRQIVAFLGTRVDGIPPLEGAALVFSSFEAMRANFRVLWDNLSSYGVEDRKIHLTLREAEKPTAPQPLSSQLPGYPGFRRRNDIQIGLEILAELFLEDITRVPNLEEPFIRETYASSGALSQYAMISRQILESRYSVLQEPDAEFEVEPVAGKKGMSKNLAQDILASGLSKRPIILLGDVGVGKTAFIRHLIHVEAKDVFDRAIVLYVDFGRKPTLLTELSDFVTSETERQLLEKYDVDVQGETFVAAVHHGQLNRFEKGVYGALREIDEVAYKRERIFFLARLVNDRESHLKACLSHMRGSMSRQIVIFLDNIDQRDADFQEQVFLLAESLASEWPATVFVSLRPDTFYRSRSEGTLTAYQPRVFTIAPPRVDIVLKRRVAFALKQLRDKAHLKSLAPGLYVESDSLETYFEVLLQNFEGNEQLIALIDNLAAGNVRRALDFVSSFIGSGHVDTSKILDIYEKSGGYAIPLHEFLRAIVYGDYEQYEPDASPVANLFDISEPDGREHFLASLLIAYTEIEGVTSGTEGFIVVDEVYEYGAKLGFRPDQITWSLDRLVRKGLLERSPKIGNRKTRGSIRVTTTGTYTARILIGMFVYLDAMVVDTPIVEQSYRSMIADARYIADRVRRAEIFKAYLDRQWRKLEPVLSSSHFNWREHSEKVAAQIIDISRRIQAT